MMRLALAALVASVASAERNTTWRYGVAGPSCETLLDGQDYVPLNATHGDLFFVGHALKLDTDTMLGAAAGVSAHKQSGLLLVISRTPLRDSL